MTQQQPPIPYRQCKYCDAKGDFFDECPNCWEIRHRVQNTNPEVVRKILKDVWPHRAPHQED